MNTGDDGCINAVPLLNAVYCADCETISDSAHGGCSVCGSHSVVNLFRMMGGSLRSARIQPASRIAKFNLSLIADIRELPADALNDAVRLLNRLAERGGDVKCLQINVDPVAPNLLSRVA